MTPEERAAQMAQERFGNACFDKVAMGVIVVAMADSIRAAEADARRQALEDAAKAAEAMAPGTGQVHRPDRDAAFRIAAAIRALNPSPAQEASGPGRQE